LPSVGFGRARKDGGRLGRHVEVDVRILLGLPDKTCTERPHAATVNEICNRQPRQVVTIQYEEVGRNKVCRASKAACGAGLESTVRRTGEVRRVHNVGRVVGESRCDVAVRHKVSKSKKDGDKVFTAQR
jgi:hypothetical protein